MYQNIRLLLAGLFALLFFRCGNVDLPETCGQSATFISTIVCSEQGDGAFSITDGDDVHEFIALNMSDFTEVANLEFGDQLTVDFVVVSEPPEGLLCGPTIVAPEVMLLCLTVV